MRKHVLRPTEGPGDGVNTVRFRHPDGTVEYRQVGLFRRYDKIGRQRVRPSNRADLADPRIIRAAREHRKAAS
jgi:hypothetical protein